MEKTYLRNYVEGKGYYVGLFNEDDIKKGIDKKKVELVKQELGLNYTNSELVKEQGKIVGIKLYVCSIDDMSL